MGGSGSGKTNSLFSSTSQHLGIDKPYLYAEDLYKAKYKCLINKIEGTAFS